MEQDRIHQLKDMNFHAIMSISPSKWTFIPNGELIKTLNDNLNVVLDDIASYNAASPEWSDTMYKTVDSLYETTRRFPIIQGDPVAFAKLVEQYNAAIGILRQTPGGSMRFSPMPVPEDRHAVNQDTSTPARY